MKRILSLILSVVIILGMLPMSTLISAQTQFSTDDFANLDMWEDIPANFRASTTPKISTASSVKTLETGETVMLPALSQGRASGMTTVKEEYFPTNKRVEMITTKFKITTDFESGNPDSAPGIYALRINEYSGLAFQFTSIGTYLNYQWLDVFYSEGALQNNKVVDCASAVGSRKTSTKIKANEWVNAALTYDYSKLDENKLTVAVVLTQGENTETVSYTKTFEETGYNAYNEGFKVGIVAAGNSAIEALFDNYAISYAKTAEDYAAEYKAKYENILNLEKVESNAVANSVFEAIAAYNSVSDETKALLSTEITKFNSLIANFKLNSYDFEGEALFNAVWETLPTGEGKYIAHTTVPSGAYSLTPAALTQKDTSALYPEIGSFNRQRRITTPKAQYLKNSDVVSFKTDMFIASATTYDNNAGLYLHYVDEYNHIRLQFQTSGDGVDGIRFQGYFGDETALNLPFTDGGKTTENLFRNKWVTVETTYIYSETSLKIVVRIYNKGTTEELIAREITVNAQEGIDNPLLNTPVRVGYGATTKHSEVYFDNFSLTFAKTADDYRDEYETVLSLSENTVTADDKTVVSEAITAYKSLSSAMQTELSEEYAHILSLKVKITQLEVEKGLLTEDFETGYNLWETVKPIEDGGIVLNPNSSDVNDSENSLKLCSEVYDSSSIALQNGLTIYKLKDNILNSKNISSIRGKVYRKSGGFTSGAFVLVYEYIDENNFSGIFVTYNDKYSVTHGFDDDETKLLYNARLYHFVDGVGTFDNNTGKASCIAPLTTDWVYFALDFTDSSIAFRVTDEFGIGKTQIIFNDNVYTENAVRSVGFSGFRAKNNAGQIPYVDDIKVSFEGTDYATAETFLAEYSDVLLKNTATIAPVDNDVIEKMLSEYGTLNENVKNILGIETKVALFEASVWEGNAANEYIERYGALIESEITAQNAAEFEAAWSVINRLAPDVQEELTEIRASLVEKLTTYSGTLDITDKIKVTVIGDSITAGFGIEGLQNNAWPKFLEDRLNAENDIYDFANLAISGYRVVGGKYEEGRLNYLINPGKDNRLLGVTMDTDIVIIALGGNDAPQISADIDARYPILVQGYIDLINFFLENSTCSTVIVSGTFWGAMKPEYKDFMKVNDAAIEACEATGVYYTPLVNYLCEKIDGKQDIYIQDDDLHYTVAAQYLIEDYFYELFTNRLTTVFRTENVSYFDVAAKSTQAKAEIPTVETLKDKAVILAAVPGCEYSIDGVNWQTSNEFTGLTVNTKYNFYQRFAETDTLFVGESSDALVVTTLDHQYDNACDTDCNLCGDIREITHDYEWVIDEAGNCGVAGKKHEECKVCDAVRSENTVITATGNHTYNAGVVTKAATCKATGVKTYTCTVCKATKTATIAKTTAHKYVNVLTRATLSKNGSIVKKCSVCGVTGGTTYIYAAKTVKLSATSYTYNGKTKKPTVTVKDSKGKTISKSYYTVKYASGRKNVGKYKVTVTFKGNYSGTKTLYFTINPVKTSITKLTAAKKALTVSISKKTKQVTGYEIQYATNKKFSKAKKATIKSYKTTKTTLKKLSSKKTYYVRVRTYKTVGKTKYYSGWSTVKYKKTK